MPDFICPFCFQKVDVNQRLFRCASNRQKCLAPDKEYSAFLDDNYNGNLEDYSGRIRSFPIVFEPAKPGAVARFFGASDPTTAICPSCRQPTTDRVCPKCHSSFPCGMGSAPNLVFAIVGAKNSGKSHYIAVLIQRIRSLWEKYNWSIHSLNDETISLYNRKFFYPLYNSEPPRALDVTHSAEGNADVKKPLLYSLTMRDSDRSVILAFFDSAGEDLTSAQQITRTKINNYIANASGIIFLVDSTKFNNEIANEREKLVTPEAKDNYVSGIFASISNVITEEQKKQIPLAVAFSKIDQYQYQESFKNSPLFQETRSRSALNLAEVDEIDKAVRDMISAQEYSFQQNTKMFAESKFFGISALGCTPNNKNELPHSPKPIRVEDPFLWLLWKYGMVASE